MENVSLALGKDTQHLEQAIFEITDTLKQSMDKKLVTCGIFLDFSTAFDTVNHKIPLSKLYHYGTLGIPLNV